MTADKLARASPVPVCHLLGWSACDGHLEALNVLRFGKCWPGAYFMSLKCSPFAFSGLG